MTIGLPARRFPPPPDVTIRAERDSDVEAIALVHRRAFGACEGPAVAQLVSALRLEPGYRAGLSLVAESAGDVIGHVMVGSAILRDLTDVSIANLSPLGVTPAWQGRGIGSALVEEVVARAHALAEPLIVLEGDPAFYARLGFEWSVPQGIHITLPSWARPECAQVILLAEAGTRLHGQVVYPPPFGELGSDRGGTR